MLQKLFFIIMLIIFVGCASDDKRSENPEGAFAIAKEYDQDERYEEALRRYQDVKSRFPYSKFATEAELAVADVYFKQESFGEAQVAYQAFKELHPKHAQIDYVTFRLALSYYNQLPETVDRDLSLAPNAITYFNEVMQKYPNSTFATEAKDKKLETLKKLAGKEEYIADFYFKRDKFDSALKRYEGLMKTYPNLGFDEKALSRAAVSAHKISDQKKFEVYYAELQKLFPGSDGVDFVRKETK